MTEVGIAFAAKAAEMAAESVADSIATQVGYIWNYKTNFENLEKQLLKLEDTRATVQHSVEEATRNGEEIERKVVNWLDSVKAINEEATKIIEDNNRANMRCLKSLCPDLKKHYQHSKKAAVKAKEVSELEKEGNFVKVSYCNPPKEIWHPSSKLFEDFESRRLTVENILKELLNPNVNLVGVYGMGGIGKTTLAKEVGKQAEEKRSFDVVVFVEVSEKPDIMKIQEAIADKLGLEFREKSESGRARMLCKRLKKESKILVILDNIWKGLELEIVGIPIGDDHQGCKLLLTARSIDVLSNDMNSLKNFSIGDLNENEAWNLFQKVAGACVEQHGLQHLASKVAKRCGGLPVAIVTIAKALKDKQVHAWSDALRELERPSSENLGGSVTAEAYLCIRLSYNHLETDELKSTFLLCSTIGFTSDASVENLLRYGMGLNLFKGVYTVEEAWDRVYTLVQKLKDSSLLLDTPVGEQFSIHDVVRDVGRAIAFSDHNNFIVDDDRILRDLVERNTLKNCTSISLLDIAELPEELNCPKVTFFYMETETQFSILGNFFKGMPNLEVLVLILTDLSPLPASLRSLTKLRTLYLHCNNGKLGDISIVGDIKNLEILVLSQSEKIIQQLPEEIVQLKRLRLLDLRNCFFFIPPNIISRLTQLEELYMGSWYDQQHAEESVASLEELKDLSHLTALDIHVTDAEILPKGLVLEKLKRYKICIGRAEWLFRNMKENLRTLKVRSDTDICSKDGVIKQLKGIEDLRLYGKQRVKNVLYELDAEGFPQLKNFHIGNNPYIVSIVDSISSATCDAFPLLETLSLSNLVSLEKICHDQLTAKSFCQLRTIKVVDCDKLKNLFSFSIAKQLSQLQFFEVVDCGNVEEIFIVDRTDSGMIDPVFINQLHSLTLKFLQRLRRICSEVEVASTSQGRQMLLTMDASSNEIISEDQLDALPLFGEKVVFPNLKNLKLHEINIKKIWPDQFPTSSHCVQSLTSLIVSECGNLRYMFSSSTIGSFKLLQHLEIYDCKDLEELIRIDDKCSTYVEFPSLEVLQIRICPALRNFIFSDKVTFPSLLEIKIGSMENLKMLWHNQLNESIQYCPKLCKVSFDRCRSLENIFPASIAKSLLQLEELQVRWCYGIKEIVAKEGEEEAAVRFFFPKLTSLNLKSLTELRCFYPGKHTTEWPKLNELNVTCCEKIDLFNSFQKNDEEGQLYFPMQQPLFLVDKAFSNLKKVTISRNHIVMLLQSPFSNHLFHELELLGVENDASSVFSLGILERFHNLEELELRYSSYKEIFSFEEIEKYIGMLGKMKSLHLNGLHSLKQMWKQDSKMDLILQKLEFLEVSYCDRLINLMPPSASFANLKFLKVSSCRRVKSLVAASTIKSLVQLEEMSISYCREMTEIISNEGDVLDGKITFGRLKSLRLHGLQNLTSFCSGNCCFNFPLLEKLIVNECPKIQFFSSRALSKPKLQKVCCDQTSYNCKHANLNTVLKQHQQKRVQHQQKRVFSILEQPTLWSNDFRIVWQHFPEQQKVFSKAKKVYLQGNDIQMIWRSQFPKPIFPKLEFLRVWRDESTVLPFGFLQLFHNMKKLELRYSSYEEIFPYEEVQKHAGAVSQIKCLRLDRLDELEEMWKPDSKLNLILQNLEVLEIALCKSLINVPSSSFENLKVLKVIRCRRLMSLLTTSTAKNLVRLEEMQICHCTNMTEVVANGGDLTEDGIIFHKLKKLELKDLSSLASFGFENHTLKFPFLEKLFVEECPNMKIFSSGDLSTPMLLEVWQDKTKYICNNDLNTILHQHYEKMVIYRKKLSFENIRVILQKFPEHEKVFSNLEQLSFSRDDIRMFWKIQFPKQYSFPKLKLLEVFEDESIVFPFSILQRFHCVEKLELNCGSYKEILSIEEDVEKHAAKIKSLSLYRLDDLKQLWKQDSNVDLNVPNLKILRVEWCGSLVSLMPSSASFRNLTRLSVEGCHRLISFVAPSTAKSLVQLKSMRIEKCNMMIEVISSNEGVEVEDEIIFSKLEFLHLDGLSSLTSFCSGNYTFNFPCLDDLTLNKCPKVKFFSSGGVLNTPELQEIEHDGTKYFCNGDLNATIQGRHETLNAKTSPKDCFGSSALSPFSASSSAN